MRIHDHFDGSNRCLECAGPCALTGDELHVTQLLRYLFESWAFNGDFPNHLQYEAISALGVSVPLFRRRANEAFTRHG